MNDQNKRARICKEAAEEFFRLLEKEHPFLAKKDDFKASILSKILNRRPHSLEAMFVYLHRYEIDLVLREVTKKPARLALQHYDKPDWQIRGTETFEEIFDDLVVIYGIGKSGDSEK